MHNPLIRLAELRAETERIHTLIAPFLSQYAADPDDPDYGEALRYYVLFTHCPAAVGEAHAPLDPATVLYNRYYWHRRLSAAYIAKHGPNAGLEQQGFQILAKSALDLGFKTIEAIERGKISANGV